MDRTFLCVLCAFARASLLAGYFFSPSRQDHKDLYTPCAALAPFVPLRENNYALRGSFSLSRKDRKDLYTPRAFATSAPLREDKLQIINDPTYVTILQPSTVKIYE